MLYQKSDGTFVIDDQPMPNWVWAEFEREREAHMAENERRYRRMEKQAAIVQLKHKLAEFDAELEASGIEDATAWEKFPAMERVMYALAERQLELEELESETSAEVAERDELIEYVEFVEEAARDELAAFGNIEFESQFNWDAKSKPEERGWSRAVLDIIAYEGAADAESLFELF